MAKAPGKSVAPQGRQGRKSPTQTEILDALRMFKQGDGVRTDGFLVLELESPKSVASARSALWNVRWKFNPDNPECKDKTGAVYKDLFESAGRGGITVYGGEGESVLIAVPESYAEKAGVTPAATTAKEK